jgi:formylglycine-generating enzyme required for sulfatase activity/tRNA A-37 threonylcarbamoyl transferase component Bud32
MLGGCRIERMIGSGGMGEVYLAQHLRLQKRVAIKTLRSDSISKERVARFVREARTCARIDHPNVVAIHDVDQQAGLHYIVMQYVEGKDLDRLLKDQGGPLPWRSALRLIRLAAKGLQAVHQQGLIHRDIKPSNIMLSADSRVLLMDFGLAREEVQSDLTQMSHVVGTPAFMSPEQFQNSGVDARSDIYSLGSTLYCLLTGRPPFPGRMPEIYAQLAAGLRPPAVCELNPLVPDEVSALVAKAIASRPADRYRDAETFSRAISQLLKTVQDAKNVEPSVLSASAFEPIPELLPLDLVPIDTTTWDSVRQHMPWIAGAAAVVVLIALGGIVNLVARSTPAAASPQAPPATPAPAELDGMVYIPAGNVRVGNDPVKLRRHLATLSIGPGIDIEALVDKLREGGEITEHVPAFWIDKYEVTNAEYARFVKQANRAWPSHWDGANPPAGKESHPVENVTYLDAAAYAKWAGKQLPTRNQWLRAFRGDTDWLFPWGDAYDATRANVADNGLLSTTPVDATPRDESPFKVRNLVGNVSEFIRTDTAAGIAPVCRGARYVATGADIGINSWVTMAASAEAKELGFGIRCVKELPATQGSDRGP